MSKESKRTHSVVPQNVFVSWSEARSGFERPKSQRAMWPVASSRMFSGFRSLWAPGEEA
jgi:hypothetical protein